MRFIRRSTIGLLSFLALVASLSATPARAGTGQSPVDPWPRSIDLGGSTATVYAPQIERWDGNRIRFRVAVSLSRTGEGEESVGAITGAAMTRVDRVARLVTLDDVTFSRSSFSGLADGGRRYVEALETKLRRTPQTIALDRLQASLAASGDIKHRGVAVLNVPPRVFVSDAPAVLVSIAGAPVLQRLADTPFERVINTRTLMLRDARGYWLRVGDGWMTADALDGRWYPVDRVPATLDRIAGKLAASAHVDLPVGGAARPVPRDVAPAVFVSHTPAALVVFDGEPALEPIAGTTLLRARNTATHVIVDIVSGHYFALLSGRWFRAPGLQGPWAHVSARGLPRDFAAIPIDDPAGTVLASVAGTPQAKEALIENSIPQTATIPRSNGPTLALEFDGHPQYRPIAGTPLSYVVNSPTPIVRVDPRHHLALKAGVWFEATSVFGPWTVAGVVPEVVYTIPPSSPLHHVTYVRIYGATPQTVEVGYTPGYTGSVITPEGVVVYGTGYAYLPWVGTAYIPPPLTYGSAAQPRDDAARNVYAHWGNAVYTGSRTYRREVQPEAYAFEVAGVDGDHYADVDGRVFRRNRSGWEKQAGRGWERASLEESAWAIREHEARASGAERYERHRARAGVERFAEHR